MKKYDKEIAQAQLNNEKAVLRNLEKNYEDALEEIDSKIAQLMGRADADMAHVIYQVDYQRALKTQIEGILLTLQTNEFETVSEYLTKCYDEGFMGTMYSLQKQGVPLAIPINQEEIAAAIQHETKLSQTLYKSFDTAVLQKKIAAEISRGFSTGASYKDMARNISYAANVEKNKAMRIARTEGHRITETAAYNAQVKAKDRGADVVKVWDAALDARTRDSHMKVDGEIRELDKKFSNGLMFPGDPSGSAAEVINCRCRSRTDARWALEADETKILGNVSEMSDKRKKEIADKLGIPVEDLEQYSDQIVPIKAKDYADFKRQYNQLWNYDNSDLKERVEPRIAKLEEKRLKTAGTTKKTLENQEEGGIIKSGADPSAVFDRKTRLLDIPQDLAAVNPNFSTGEWMWQNNCQRCVPTYEMRRRGYRVTAKPIPSKNDVLYMNYAAAWENQDRVWCMKGSGKAQIQEQMAKWGDGARAEVAVAWSSSTGHVFVAEQIDGKTVFFDPQNPGIDASQHFKNCMKGLTNILRIDNNKPSDYILDCCQNWSE